MSASLLQKFRLLHRKIASLLFIFFFFISLTAIMLAWKSAFTKVIFENSQAGLSTNIHEWLSLDSLESLATVALNEQAKTSFAHAENIQLKPSKGYINFAFKNNYNIQVNGASGKAIHIERKNGSFIQDIHDGAIIDSWLSVKSGIVKKTYSTLLGTALLLLTISGWWMWYKPRQIKLSKKKFVL